VDHASQNGSVIVRFSNRAVLVAGGTGGLGRSVTLAFLNEGANVVVTYQRQDEFENLRRTAGLSLEGNKIDVTDPSAVGTFVNELVAKHKKIDVLVNTVGGYAGGLKLWETDPNVFDRMIALNLRSNYVLSRAVAPAMLKQGRGAIVNVIAKAAVDHGAGASAYAASKAGALAMTDSLAADLKGSGVRVNSILPSIIDTEVNRKAMPGADFSKWPKPEDIARVILFLCSDDAKVVHGAAVSVYGDS
jgi:NAD(P)-dependent dehydrogenase (short-subunit alcohol dehydrogenase family)